MSEIKNILLIEDDKVHTALVTKFLEDTPFKLVKCLETGQDAIEYITNNNDIDLIISDIGLPGGLSGIELGTQISKISDVPIIFNSVDIHSDILQSNPYGYLLKPFEKGELIVALCIAFHRYEMEKLQHSYEAHLKQAQRLGNMGSWEWNIQTSEISWTDQTYRIFGLEPQLFTPNFDSFLDRIYPDDRHDVQEAVNNAIEYKEPYDIEHRIITIDGTIRHIKEYGEVEYNLAGDPVRMIGTVLDITERKQKDNALEHLAFHDPLTGLANRQLLMDRLDIILATAKRRNTQFSLLFIDLDKFKPVNDQYGHKAGDKILIEMSKRLNNFTRESDTVARIGGDEFVIILNDAGSEKQTFFLAEKILKEIEKPFKLQADITINISASIGISIYPEHGSTIDELLTLSDNAMYSAKKNEELNIVTSSHHTESR